MGRSLDRLDLPVNNGRIDLRGISLPEPLRSARYATSLGVVDKVEGATVIRNSKWHDLDFSGSKLKTLRLFDCELQNCSFDNCDLRDLRLWSTKIVESTFRRANLKESALGGVQNGSRNLFEGVDFTEADLSRTAYTAALFHRCTFSHTKLEKVDFQTTAFSECKFEGPLSHVLFYRRAFNGEAFPPNEMVDVDFRRATLRFVEFRG